MRPLSHAVPSRRRRRTPRIARLLALLVAAAVSAGACSVTDGLSSFDVGPGASSASQAPVTLSPSPAAPTPSLSATDPPSPSPARSPDPTPAVPSPLFGFAGHLMWDTAPVAIRQLDMLAEDRLHVIRFDVSWRNMEPQAGSYRYLDKLDEILDASLARDILPIVAIMETPAWANGGRDGWVPPDDPADFARFAAMLADRYRGRVLGWEIWNEPDLQLFWRPKPSAAAYTELLVAASAAIRAADPDARVVAAGATFGNLDFLQALYDGGARGTFDALAVHPYTLGRAPDDETDRYHSFTAIVDDVHDLMTANGDEDVPVWVTELGWATTGANSTTKERQARYMARSVELVRDRPWIQVLAMYTIDVRHSVRLGLSENGRRSASWRAYVAAVHAGD